MNSYERFCFNLLGERVKARREKYSELRKDLLSARIQTPFEVYLSTAFVTSILVGLLAAVSIGTITYIFKLTKLITYRGAVPEALVPIANYSLFLGTIAVTIISLLVFGGLTYFVYNLYPSISRKPSQEYRCNSSLCDQLHYCDVNSRYPPGRDFPATG